MLTCTQGPRGHTGPHPREDGPKALMCDVLSTDGDNPLSPITLHMIVYRIVSNYSIIYYYLLLLLYYIPLFLHHSLILKGHEDIR